MMKISLFLVLTLLNVSILGQNRTLSGRISGTGSDVGLAGAHISIYDLIISGLDGAFIITGLPAEKLKMTISYLGYRFSQQEIDLSMGNVSGKEITLEASPVEVGEVMVGALRQDKMLRDVALPLAIVNENRVDQLPAVTISNLFQDIPGVNLARDGIWATSMNIRGLTEQRIVVLVDGNRIETASDVAGGLAMIDINDVERIEVIKGAASSLYGTGAMGGVVNIVTKEGHYSDKLCAGGSVSGIYQTVNHLHSENIALNLADEKWYVRLSGTYRDAGNSMTPEGELLNSQFTDNNISLKLGVKPMKKHELIINYQRFDARDVGIPGGIAFPAKALAIYPEEKRNMFSATYSINRTSGTLSRIKFRYFHQYLLRDVELKPKPSMTISPSGYHTTNGFQIQSDWDFGEKQQLIAGIDIWQRYLSTEREKTVVTRITNPITNVSRDSVNITVEVPIPDAWFTSGGVFLQDRISFLDNRMSLTLGGRLDLVNTRNDQAVDPLYKIIDGVRTNNPLNQRVTFEANNINNISWSLDAGALYHLYPNTDLTLTVSKAYRAPGIEERFKYIDLGSSVRIGDPKLKPEQGYFFDLGTRVWKDKFQFTGNIFANAMTNLIVESPGLFIYNYSSSPSKYDTLNALINSNVDKALLYGFDVSSGYNIFDGVTIKTTAGFVRGKNTLKNSDLPQIPPFNGTLTIKYNFAGYFSTEVSANLFAGQEKIAAGEKATKGFARYDLGIYSVPIKIWNMRLEAFGGIQNITNRAYMNHLSTNRGVIKYEPGRNFFLKVRFSF
jgi:hemoglobin/transferrin/lactoferrin receptor protein